MDIIRSASLDHVQVCLIGSIVYLRHEEWSNAYICLFKAALLAFPNGQRLTVFAYSPWSKHIPLNRRCEVRIHSIHSILNRTAKYLAGVSEYLLMPRQVFMGRDGSMESLQNTFNLKGVMMSYASIFHMPFSKEPQFQVTPEMEGYDVSQPRALFSCAVNGYAIIVLAFVYL